MKNERNPVDSIIILKKKINAVHAIDVWFQKEDEALFFKKIPFFFCLVHFSRGVLYRGMSKALAGRSQRPSIRQGAASVVSRLLLELKITYFFLPFFSLTF
jgi:hypothetical protein